MTRQNSNNSMIYIALSVCSAPFKYIFWVNLVDEDSIDESRVVCSLTSYRKQAFNRNILNFRAGNSDEQILSFVCAAKNMR